MLVDSISVAGLAGYSDAPIVLTPSGMLHDGVADFVEDYGVETVYVLGGAAAVSDSVVTALEGLNAEPEVMRISGDDRYATYTNVPTGPLVVLVRSVGCTHVPWNLRHRRQRRSSNAERPCPVKPAGRTASAA